MGVHFQAMSRTPIFFRINSKLIGGALERLRQTEAAAACWFRSSRARR